MARTTARPTPTATPDVETSLAPLPLLWRHHVGGLHQELVCRRIAIAPRTVQHLVERYEELVALSLSDTARLHQLTTPQAGSFLPSMDYNLMSAMLRCITPCQGYPMSSVTCHYLQRSR